MCNYERRTARDAKEGLDHVLASALASYTYVYDERAIAGGDQARQKKAAAASSCNCVVAVASFLDLGEAAAGILGIAAWFVGFVEFPAASLG